MAKPTAGYMIGGQVAARRPGIAQRVLLRPPRLVVGFVLHLLLRVSPKIILPLRTVGIEPGFRDGVPVV